MRSFGSRSRAKSFVWHVTFGDLLTLLVCFFLVLTQETSAKRRIDQYKQGVSDTGERGFRNGTDLASSGENRSATTVAKLAISRATLRDGTFVSSVRTEVKDFMSSVNAYEVQAKVSLCRSFLKGKPEDSLVVEDVYAAISSATECIRRIEIGFDGTCAVDGLGDQSSIGDVTLVTTDVV